MTSRALLLAMMLVIGVIAPAAADLAAGRSAYFAGDYAAGFRVLEPLARQGNAEAQYYMGLMYLNGSGEIKDFAKAAHWFREAAEQEHGDAQYALGLLYRRGLGVEQDSGEASLLFESAYLNGYPDMRASP